MKNSYNGLTRCISAFFITLCIGIVIFMGIVSSEHVWLVPILFPIINFCAFIFWNTTKTQFPYYFHIGLLFLLMSNKMLSSDYLGLVAICAIAAGVIIATVTCIVSRIKKADFKGDWPFRQIIVKYRDTFGANPCLLKKSAAHLCILLIISIVAVFFYGYRGYWIIVSASATLIGSEYDKIKIRGIRRIVGALLGFAVGCALVALDVSKLIRGISLLISLILVLISMPQKYIIGSACIGLQCVLSFSILEGSLAFNMVAQRFVWTVFGAVLSIFLCFMACKADENLYAPISPQQS